jgi:hypothetical protein
MRRVAMLAVQTGLFSWLWKNRGDLGKRVKTLVGGRKTGPKPDTTRPIGDRFVPPIAGRGPSSFEAAKAEEAPPTSPGVAAREQASNSHVSISVEGNLKEDLVAGTQAAGAKVRNHEGGERNELAGNVHNAS